ncbi:TPA: sodium/proline symporter PutP [Corynebacterium striatum]|nr:sodium/proline symporter PutP [Corynebacterium striatum]MCG7248842.1 sodium/proline symporter PutP [Corynebacterium striatum]HBC4101994.1 sodium/proline symporter PutP [Corynebacterium striatum]HCD1551638.1 sodium/proline symporter PutP [Corynebacterium striatum]HCD1824555.1 sodium/proline symporter PutP [Corynebacterium striatum]HCD2180852.1 sodium/proline symporter PutP [Corynebacterium striatum]
MVLLSNFEEKSVQDSTWYVVAMIIYLLAMAAIGFWSYKQTDQYDDYVLGGRGLHPFVAALSAGASDMSGWLLMGLPGALFLTGMSELWMAIGLLVGAWANWKWVAPRLRSYSEIAGNSITVPSFFENRLHDKSRLLRVLSAAIIIFFFTFYVSSGMVSGGRYFESTFGGDYLVGMLIVAAVTVFYTFVGGFLAVSYTDTVQGLLMFASLIIVPIMAIMALDDPGQIFSFAANNPYATGGVIENPNYFSLFSGVSAAVIIGNLAWGLGYFGQPHIIVRFMALRKPSDARAGRFYGIGWMLLSLIGAVFVALAGTVFFTQTNHSITDQENYETIFLDMAQVMFHPLFAGLVLTAVLAAIMSTMSSQMLVVSTSLIEDLFLIFAKKKPSQDVLINLSRTAVVGIAVIAAVLAINPSDSILGLVGFAWAGFGSAFGPLVLLSLYWKRLNSTGAIAGMVTGAIVAIGWGMSPLSDALYELVPGFAISLIATVVVSLVTKAPEPKVMAEFEEASKLAKLVEENKNLDFEQAAERVQN